MTFKKSSTYLNVATTLMREVWKEEEEEWDNDIIDLSFYGFRLKLTRRVGHVVFWSHFWFCLFFEIRSDFQDFLITAAWGNTSKQFFSSQIRHLFKFIHSFYLACDSYYPTSRSSTSHSMKASGWESEKRHLRELIFRDLPFSWYFIINLWLAHWCVTHHTHTRFTIDCFTQNSFNSNQSVQGLAII